MPLFTSEYVFSDDYPTIEPSLKLDFANARALDPRITFTRASTATYVGANGLIKTAGVDEARFDHDPATGESLGLLVEESRTNQTLYSEELTNPSWVITNNLSRTSNVLTSPDGNLTADLLSRTGNKQVNYQLTPGAGTYTFSIYAKSNTSNFVTLASSVGFLGEGVTFNLSTGVSGGIQNYVDGPQSSISVLSSLIISVGNGWYRCSITFTTTVSRAYHIEPGDLTNAAASAYFWGAQLEQGFSSTSYIPTSGSTVTRSADTAQITGTNFSSWYNQSEGSFIFNSKTFEQDGNNNYYGETGDGTGGNRNIMYSNANSGSGLYYYITNTTAYVITLNSGYQYQLNTYVKIGYCYKENDFGVFAPGGLSNTDNGGLIHTANSFAIGTNNTSLSEHLNGHLKQVIYYPTRLTNAQLQSLTS